MAHKTFAEAHEELMEFGVERYRDTFIAGFKQMTEGGRYPGMPEPTDMEWRALYLETPPEVFQQIAMRNPKKAIALMEKFAGIEAKVGNVLAGESGSL